MRNPDQSGAARYKFILVILLSTALVVAAGQPEPANSSIELSLGETAYVHLTSATPTGRPVAAIRVGNPNRDHSIVKVTFEADVDSGKHRLRVRNGYENPVFLATLCPRPADVILPQRVLIGAPPGRETIVEVPLSITRLSLCDFTVSIGPVG